MKILKKNLKEGLVVLVPDNLDDLWHLDKILEKGDLVSASTTRKFVSESGKSERKEVRVTLELESLDFNPSSERLHVLGTITEGRPEKYVSLGAHHSIDVNPGIKLGVKKHWKKHQLDRLEGAVRASKQPKLVIIALDDEEAEIALLLDSGIKRKANIKSGKSGKQYESSSKQGNYLNEVFEALKLVKASKIIVAGPGFTKDDFKDFCAEREPDLAGKILVEGAGSGGESGVREVIKRGVVERVAAESRLSKETLLVEEVLKEIAQDGLVSYGLKEVKQALDCSAVKTLLVSDSLFQKERDKAERLMDKADQARAEAYIINSEEEPGKKLDAIGGVAALLRFKVS